MAGGVMVGWLVSRTTFSGHLRADLFGEHRLGRRQTPAGDQQQSRKRASDEDKVAGYGHCLPLLQN